MLFPYSVYIDKDVINIGGYKVIKVVAKYKVNILLKCGWGFI